MVKEFLQANSNMSCEYGTSLSPYDLHSPLPHYRKMYITPTSHSPVLNLTSPCSNEVHCSSPVGIYIDSQTWQSGTCDRNIIFKLYIHWKLICLFEITPEFLCKLTGNNFFYKSFIKNNNNISSLRYWCRVIKRCCNTMITLLRTIRLLYKASVPKDQMSMA